jgi:hypothetical protein
MNIQCPHCQHTTELNFPSSWKHFGCPKCYTLFSKKEDGTIQQTKIQSANRIVLHLHIGQFGVLDGIRWEVTNACIKFPVSEPFGWQEYTLRNRDGEECFLSEYNGHWTLAKEVTDPSLQHDIRSQYELQHGDDTYRLFHDSQFKTEFLSGFFEETLPTTGHAKDFVSPPKAVLLERAEGDPVTYTFEARYVSGKEMQEAFPTYNPTRQEGVGMLQPFPTNMVHFGLIVGAFGFFLTLYQLFFTFTYPSRQVLKDLVMLPDSVAEVSHVSPSFKVSGTTGPLEIKLSAPVQNSWVAADFTLVNEDTREERYGSVDIAYYFGVDGGESWAEGSNNPSIKICGVAPGNYHLDLQVAKNSGDSNITSLRYTVIAQASTFWNLLTCLIILVAAFIILLIYRSHYEQQRWMLSDFPPETE